MEEFVMREVMSGSHPILEKYGFVKFGKTNNYMSIYEPSHKNGKTKLILICDSLWDEQERTLVFNAKLARLLASAGYTVVRFDYTGSGNSDGDNADITFQSLGDDVDKVIAWCMENYYQVECSALICERIGCHILFEHPSVTTRFEKTIFIHPVFNISHFFTWNFIEREIINNNAFSKVKLSRQMLQRDLVMKDEMDLNGYTFKCDFVNHILASKELWKSFIPTNNCLYIFDESFNRVREKWGNKLQSMEFKVVQMNSVAVSSWDREDLKDDKGFFQLIYSTISYYLNQPLNDNPVYERDLVNDRNS